MEERQRIDELKHTLPLKRGFFVGWTPPPCQKVTINNDGTTKGNLGVAGTGCVIRDKQGK